MSKNSAQRREKERLDGQKILTDIERQLEGSGIQLDTEKNYIMLTLPNGFKIMAQAAHRDGETSLILNGVNLSLYDHILE